MPFLRNVLSVPVATLIAASGAYAASSSAKEDYVHAPMPAGIQVVDTELEGPVFADAQGHTIYKWPKEQLRNGDAGEIELKPTCDNTVYRENAGLTSPYPPGLELPDADKRPSCTGMWPPVLAAADAKEMGKWKPTDRPDGRKQWTYEGWPLYTSVLDKRPGDTIGGSVMFHYPEAGGTRYPVGAEPNVPAQFAVRTTMSGRMITQRDGWSIFSYEGDSRNKSNCTGACLDGWAPILAADYARPVGEWTTFERAPGVRQWAFRGMPVYRYLPDSKTHSQDGTDVPRWHNVYTQKAPAAPKGFTVKDTLIGVVLADEHGKTIYKYHCAEDSLDQLPCDVPETPQVYRLTVCGGGDPDLCLKTFPYVIAPAGAKSGNQTWEAMYIDPKTGKKTTAGQPGALNVWAFRGIPVNTFAGNGRGYADEKPDDIKGHNWGEFAGRRNGYTVMAYRDLYSNRDE